MDKKNLSMRTSILRDYPQGENGNLDEEDVVSEDDKIKISKIAHVSARANGSPILRGNSFGYRCFSDGAPRQDDDSVHGSFPSAI